MNRLKHLFSLYLLLHKNTQKELQQVNQNLLLIFSGDAGWILIEISLTVRWQSQLRYQLNIIIVEEDIIAFKVVCCNSFSQKIVDSSSYPQHQNIFIIFLQFFLHLCQRAWIVRYYQLDLPRRKLFKIDVLNRHQICKKTVSVLCDCTGNTLKFLLESFNLIFFIGILRKVRTNRFYFVKHQSC